MCAFQSTYIRFNCIFPGELITATNSIEQSLTVDANRCSVSQDIFHLLRNRNAHYHLHNSSLLAPILSHMDPDRISYYSPLLLVVTILLLYTKFLTGTSFTYRKNCYGVGDLWKIFLMYEAGHLRIKSIFGIIGKLYS